jgi:beta-lactamase class A
MKKSILYYGGLGLACVASFFGGWYARIQYTNAQPSRLVEIRENDTLYHYINPLILVDTPRQAPEFGPLKENVNDYISEVESEKSASSVSVYFRDLNSGRWTGINEDESYDPSSLLKVAVMVGYLKKASDDATILLKKLPYVYTSDPGQNYKPEHPLQNGTYTIRDLLQAMIIGSDNDALALLYNNDRDAFVDVLKTLQIPPPKSLDALDFISPKEYSSVFRTLYSSTYLPRGFSEQALDLLVYTDFKNGIVSGVPAGTIVAHKFGEHTTAVNDIAQSRQLHDCGIIYYPGKPYLLCVMTRGNDFKSLESVLSNISKITYTFVSNNKF